MKKGLFVFSIIILLVGTGIAQIPLKIEELILKGKQQIQQAVDVWDLKQMLAARAIFERLSADESYPWLVHYYIGYMDMCIFHYHMSQEDKENAGKVIDDGIVHLEKALEIKDDFADGYALLSSLLGNKIGLNPMLGMSLGMKSGSLIQKAFELAPENPRVSLIAGQSAYYTPAMFGGGKDKAWVHLQKAIGYFETFKPEMPILPTWGHEEAYAYVGLIQMEKDDFAEARRSFEKALEINPDYGWVRHDLLNRLKKENDMEESR